MRPTCAAAAFLLFGAPAWASPPLETPPAELAAALHCPVPLDAPGPDPVLLVHGTHSNHTQYLWNYVPAFDALGIPYCLVDLLDNGSNDIQISAERIVYAIGEMHAASGDLIDVVGHSQGGMIPRWAFKYWPETRAMVDDHIGHAPSNHGTPLAGGTCGGGSCPEAEWQQTDTSNFLAALNDGPEVFPEIDYTAVYSYTDEIVFPQVGPDASSPLRGGGANVTNVALQEVCPNDPNEHLAIGTYDAVAWALTMDALQNPGPADPARVPLSVCAEPFMPGVDPLTFADDYSASAAVIGEARSSHPPVDAEPPLKPYALPEPGALAGLLAGGLALAGLRPRRTAR